MDNLELLNEFFSNCHEPKTPKIRSRLISLLYQYQPIIWIQRNESGVVELAYLKKELAQIIQNEYAIKLSSFERKLKEDLGLKVIQTTHGRRNIKLFHTPSKYNGNEGFMENSFVSSSEFNLSGVNRGGNRSPREMSPERNFSQQSKFDIGSIVNPMSNVSISTSPRGNNSGMQNTSPRIIQNSPPRSLISQSPPRSIKDSPPFTHNTTFIPQTNFNMNISNNTSFFPINDNGFQSNNSGSFSNNSSPRENNSGRSSPNRNLSFNEYEAAMCLTNMKTFF